MRLLSTTLAFVICTACASHATLPEEIYPDEVIHPLPADLSQFRQPESLVEDLGRIQAGTME